MEFMFSRKLRSCYGKKFIVAYKCQSTGMVNLDIQIAPIVEELQEPPSRVRTRRRQSQCVMTEKERIPHQT